MKKKGLSLIIIVCLMICLLPENASAVLITEINTAEDFKTFCESVAADDNYTGQIVTLNSDITLPNNWAPVGWHGRSGNLSDCKAFNGTFNGGGHTITFPETIKNNATDNYIALFANNTGTITNLTVAGGVLQNTCNNKDIYMAGIAAYNSGTVRNCVSNISFKGDGDNSNKYFAGVVALNDTSGVVEECEFSGETTFGGVYKAGIVAQNNGTVRNCCSNAIIHFGNRKGGIVAVNEASGTVTKCYYIGSNRYGMFNGGIAHDNKGIISYCFVQTVSLSGDNPGAIVYSNTGSITNCYTTVNAPLVRVDTAGGTVTDCYYDNQACTATSLPGEGLPTLRMTQTTALNAENMGDLGGPTVWTTKTNIENTDDVTLHYPQLKYFADKGHDFISAKGYRLSYDLNGVSGTIPAALQRAGEQIPVADVSAVVLPAGVTFTGWNTQRDGTGTGYATGTNFTANTNSTLYAQWNGLVVTPPSSSVYIPIYRVTTKEGITDGSVKISNEYVVSGGKTVITVLPEEGFAIEDVLINGVSVGPVLSYVIEPVQKDIVVEARFTPITDEKQGDEEKKLIHLIENNRLVARSRMSTLHGQRAVLVRWFWTAGTFSAEDFDGFEIMRSENRFSGYGSEPYFTTDNLSYRNNKDLEDGTRYYYKVRGWKTVNGKKVYTQWSLKAWRMIWPE